MGNAVGVEAKAAGAVGPIGRELSAGAKVGPKGLLTEEAGASDATAATAADEAAPSSPSAAAATSPRTSAAASPPANTGEDEEGESALVVESMSEGTSERQGPGISSTFSYSHAQGWYAGVSAVGEVIHARTADNEEYYGIDGVTVLDILRGKVPKPRGKAALELYALLDALVSRSVDR